LLSSVTLSLQGTYAVADNQEEDGQDDNEEDVDAELKALAEVRVQICRSCLLNCSSWLPQLLTRFLLQEIEDCANNEDAGPEDGDDTAQVFGILAVCFGQKCTEPSQTDQE